jgi:CyaY protein
MTEPEFLALAERTLAAIERAVDAAVKAQNADIEASRSGNVLTLELDDGSRVVINSQAPMQQIWVAAKSGAHHYSWRDLLWRDTRDDSELYETLSRLVSQQGGAAVILRP